MTKTKSQLRAEAVERLKELDALITGPEGMIDKIAEGLQTHRFDYQIELEYLIELLTDDECGQPCYTCSRLAELINENGQLRAKLDEERKLDDELLEKYLNRGEQIADLKERVEELEADNIDYDKALDSVKNERDELKAKLESCGQYSDQREQPETTADESCDTREEPYIVVDGERKWVEADSREKLEADAGELTADYASSGGVCDALYCGIIDLLDRQAAITERERLDRDERFCDECWKGQDTKLHELQAKVDELTDETTFLHCIAKKCGTKDVPSLKAYVEQLEAKVDELTADLNTAERDSDFLRDENEKLQARIGELCIAEDEDRRRLESRIAELTEELSAWRYRWHQVRVLMDEPFSCRPTNGESSDDGIITSHNELFEMLESKKDNSREKLRKEAETLPNREFYLHCRVVDMNGEVTA